MIFSDTLNDHFDFSRSRQNVKQWNFRFSSFPARKSVKNHFNIAFLLQVIYYLNIKSSFILGTSAVNKAIFCIEKVYQIPYNQTSILNEVKSSKKFKFQLTQNRFLDQLVLSFVGAAAKLLLSNVNGQCNVYFNQMNEND